MSEDTFLEIILFLSERFSEAYPQKWELDEASEFLLEMGYDRSAVNRAISWFFLQAEPDATDYAAAPVKKSVTGFRVLSPQEMSRITPEAYGYLIELKRLGIIDDDSLEDVMDNAMATGDELIDREDVIQIVNRVLRGFSDEDMDKAR